MADTLPSAQRFREACHALAGVVPDGSAHAVHHRAPPWALRDDRALCPLQHQPEDRLRVARPLRGGGARRLHARSHAPHVCPHAIDGAVAALLLDARRQHSTWGPAKLLHSLASRHAAVGRRPAISTVADLLARHALVDRRPRPVLHPGTVPLHAAARNDLWTAEFKGQFRTREGVS